MLYSIYTNNPPEIIDELVHTTEMQRLGHIGMNCGCEYTGYDTYKNMIGSYTRLSHSIGVAYIVWNFTEDIVQTIAGLLHDIATPVFAHTIDFMNNDHIRQESTEKETYRIINESVEIMDILNRNGIAVEDVSDYHMYPIADNDTPMLSADRLEYSIGNAFWVHKADIDFLKNIYNNISVTHNEKGNDELYFKDMQAARSFTELSLNNSYCFVSDEDRYAMQRLADIIKYAIHNNVISMADLYRTEDEVIKELKSDNVTAKLWSDYTNIKGVCTSTDRPESINAVNVAAKLRYINTLVNNDNKIVRISEADKNIFDEISRFKNSDFNIWIWEITGRC